METVATRWRSARWQLRAAAILFGGALRGLAQYRADLAMSVLGGVIYQGVSFLAVWVILARFDTILGWTVAEVALMYGIRLTAHGIWVIPLNQLRYTEDYVREGTFDRFLVRPANPLVQLLATRVRLHGLGDFIAGATMLAVAMSLVTVDWTPWRLVFLAAALLGGALIEGAFQLAMSAIAFRTLGSREMRFTVDTVFNLYGGYPSAIFGRVGQWVLTAVLPVAFVGYLPAVALLGRTGDAGVPAVSAYLTPVVGVGLFAAAYAVWRGQLWKYQGAGS